MANGPLPPLTFGMDAENAYDQLRAERLWRTAYPQGVPQYPQQQAQPFRLGGLRIPGQPMEDAALAILQQLQANPRRPRNFGEGLAQGFVGGLSGSISRGAVQRQQFNEEQRQRQMRAEDEAQRERSGMAAKLATWRHDPNRIARSTQKFILSAKEAKALDDPQYTEGMEVPGSVKAEAMHRTRPQQAASYNLGFDPDSVAHGIMGGDLPPLSSGFSRGQWGQIATSIRKINPRFSLSRATLAWRSTEKHINALNSRQQLQLHNSAEAVSQGLPELSRLNKRLTRLIPRGKVIPVNRLAVSGTQELGLGGEEAQAVAQKMLTIMNTIEPELGNVYRAGGVPTDQAMDLVHQTFNMSLPPHVLDAAIEAETFMLNVRINAIRESRPMIPGGGDNMYTDEPAEGSAAPTVPKKGNSRAQSWVEENTKKFLKR